MKKKIIPFGLEFHLKRGRASKILEKLPDDLKSILEAVLWLRTYKSDNELEVDLEAVNRLCKTGLISKQHLPSRNKVVGFREQIAKCLNVLKQNNCFYNSDLDSYVIKLPKGRSKNLITACVFAVLKDNGGAELPMGDLQRIFSVIFFDYFSEDDFFGRNGQFEKAIKSFRKDFPVGKSKMREK